MIGRRLLLCIFLLSLSAIAGNASADDDDDNVSVNDIDSKPAEQEDDDAKDRARELYDQGNGAYVDGRFTEALELYKTALTLWDHPKVRFNTARSLVHIGKPVEAYYELERAMAKGPDELGADKYQEGKTMRRLLRGQLAELSVRCESDGALVTLDGEELLKGGGAKTILLSPGEHQLVAEEAGMERLTERLSLSAGSTRTIEVVLVPPAPLPPPPVRKRRWPRWQPWTVAAIGGVLIAGGTVSAALSVENYDRFDDALVNEPSCSNGCSDEQIPSRIRDFRRRGDQQRVGAIVGVTAGVATLTLGVLMIVRNDPREHPAPVTAFVGRGRFGLSVVAKF